MRGCRPMTLFAFVVLAVTSLCPALSSDFMELLSEGNVPGIDELLSSAPEHSIQDVSDVYISPVIAADFLNTVNSESRHFINRMAEAGWSYSTNITDYNSRQLLDASTEYDSWFYRTRQEAKKFNIEKLPNYLSRQLSMFTLSADPSDPEKTREISELQNKMTGLYGSARGCLNNGLCLTIEPELEDIMAHSRDPEVLKEAWLKWRDAVGPRIKPYYVDFIRLHNEGAVENGYRDYSQYWKKTMFFDDTEELDGMLWNLWHAIKPLYLELHAYVRRKLREHYGSDVVGNDGTIPAHLLGNMWGQHWNDIADIVNPYPGISEQSYMEAQLKSKVDVLGMYRLAENFYKSMGFPGMTPAFWEKSMLVKPEGRDVVCHASAKDMYYPGDFRIKMCTKVTLSDFNTIHHEMGHIQYFMAYADQPTIYRNGANGAFHEAVGDTIGLSVMSAKHLKALGLMEADDQRGGAKDSKEDLGEELRRRIRNEKSTVVNLLNMALQKLAFLPFGVLVDMWRWEAMQGKITPESYNRRWWELRLQYQGIKAPVPRSEADFDPAAKYHIPSHTSYVHYFISTIQQFQMYKALCQESGHRGPLHECDFYGSTSAGNRLRHTLSYGASTPWKFQLYSLTGNDHVTADAIKEYFKPLYRWLVVDNSLHSEKTGWEGATINWKDD